MKYVQITLTIALTIVLQSANAQVLDSMFGVLTSFTNLPNSKIFGNTSCDFEGRKDQCYGIINLDDGRIILAGDTRAADGTADFALARLLPNGLYDDTAGPDGEMRLDLGYDYDSCLTATKYQNNYILMGGGVRISENYVNLLAKVDFDGVLEPSFGDSGKMVLDLPSTHEMVTKITPLPDGKILIAGNVLYGNSCYFPDSTAVFIGRLHASGQIDSTFGSNGFVYHWFEATCKSSLLGDIAIDHTGRIIFTGGSYDPYPGFYDFNDWCTQNIVVYRLLSEGALDTDFGVNGKVEIMGKYSRGNALYTYEDGRVLLAGVLGDQLVGEPTYAFVTRILTDGNLDTSFGVNGWFKKFILSIDVGSEPVDIIVQNNNILFTYLSDPNGAHTGFGVYCLDSNGQINTQFGNNGKYEYIPLVLYFINQITSTDNNNIFVSGYYRIVNNNMVVIKIKTDDVSAANQAIISNKISISPNPIDNLFNIFIPEHIVSKDVNICIRDINGRAIFSKNIFTNSNSIEVNISDLPTSMYVLELTADNMRYVNKIVVHK